MNINELKEMEVYVNAGFEYRINNKKLEFNCCTHNNPMWVTSSIIYNDVITFDFHPIIIKEEL